jgi:hypothetical protein
MEDVQIRVADHVLHLDKAQLAATLYAMIPEAIKQPESQDAKKYQALRLGLKGLIRPYLTKFIPALFARLDRPAPKIPPAKDADLLLWLSNLLVGMVIEEIARREWRVILEPVDGQHWHVVGLAAVADQDNEAVGSGSGSEKHSA